MSFYFVMMVSISLESPFLVISSFKLFSEFAFYVNKSGRRARNEFMVYWEGVPTGFGT